MDDVAERVFVGDPIFDIYPLYRRTMGGGIFTLVNGNRFTPLRTYIGNIQASLDNVLREEQARRTITYVTRGLRDVHEKRRPLFPIAPTVDDCYIHGHTVYVAEENEFHLLVNDTRDGKHRSLRSIFMCACLLTPEMRRYMVETLHHMTIPYTVLFKVFQGAMFQVWKFSHCKDIITRSEKSRRGQIPYHASSPIDYIIFVRNIWNHERDYRKKLETLLKLQNVSDGRYWEYYCRSLNPFMFRNLLIIWRQLNLPSRDVSSGGARVYSKHIKILESCVLVYLKSL